MNLAQYVLEPLRRDEEFVLYRARPSIERGFPSVLLRAPVSEHPALATLQKIEHEYSLRHELDSAWAVRPLGLSEQRGQPMLVLEDPGGDTLENSVSGPMDTAQFLRVAIGFAAALGGLHGRRLIHKDVKPAHALVDPATGQIRLTGFGIASRVPRERQAPHPPETLAGTLAYMAPEQTGRMNRSIDARSDLYALGVTLYELLTGSRPFTAADPMEWVHCHIARQPLPPSERVNQVPVQLSAIIMKLLAKTAEERYQTAAGLERDLRRCLAQFEADAHIDDFILGDRDTPDRLVVPEKLYGRARQIETLLAAFDRIVNHGPPELVLVSGYAGVGKSSVVNELHKVLVPPRGLFAAGKFDQYKRDIPYSTVAQAFQALVRPLLAKSEEELGRWREALREALGPIGQLMVDLVPDLTLIVGEQAPVPELPPQDAQRRFQVAFRRFVAVFARPEHPLALFLDDLQWLDSATLALLEDLSTQPDFRHLLLIGAYRDNEVTAAHPLTRTLDRIRGTGASVHEIVLAPLTHEHVGHLVADSLSCDHERAAPLAALVHQKTAGNPFFVIQFLSALAEEGLLTFDHETARWSWDPDRMRAKGYTDNVVDLMVAKLTRLPSRTQDALEQLACLGNGAEAALLAMTYDRSKEELQDDLLEALQTGLVLHADGIYRFLHDRVQEAAYALIPETRRPEAHLRIGRLLAAHTPPDRRDDAIFEIVNQLNRGAPLVTSDVEREQLAELNLAAAMRAIASSAYASALTYLRAGAALLSEEAWERRQELAFTLALHSADCEVCAGTLQAAEERLAALATRAADTIQRCAVARRRVDLYTMLGTSDRAVEVGLECLRHAGIDLPAHPTTTQAIAEYERLWSRLGSGSIEDLVELPLMHDAESLATLDVLTVMTIPTHYTDENLHVLIVSTAVDLCLKRGNSDAAPASYSAMGLIACTRFSHHDQGYRLAHMACSLVERRGLQHFGGGRTYFNFAVLVPWTRPLREAIDPARRAFQMGKDIGHPTFAALAGRTVVSTLLAAGHPLDHLESEAEQAAEFVQPYGFFLDRISAPLALVRTLRGRTATFGSLDDGQFAERPFEQRLTGHPTYAFLECHYWIRKLQARFFAGDYASALDAADKAERWYERVMTLTQFLAEMADFHFYAALSRSALCEAIGSNSYVMHQGALQRHEQRLRAWAALCPQNFEDRATLVDAEIARIEGQELNAERLYEAAIRSARENRFVHHEAIALELAARFYAGRGLGRIARIYLRDARDCYRQWGAEGKVRELEQQYPYLADEQPSRDPTQTMVTPVDQLDLSTVLTVSQAVQGETDLETLITAVMRLAVEHAGAERGLLILPHGDAYQIEAQARSGHERVTVELRPTSIGADDLPPSVLQYVLRTHERVCLRDAAGAGEWADDEYVRRHHARSVLCIPLLKQTRLAGILYLENNLTADAFTPARMALLEVLASDAAISLENARLYQEISALKDQLYKENLVLRDEVDRTSMFEEIVGTSPALQPVLARVAKVARTDSTVLITGETGTGKELVARAIHRLSTRAAQAFVSVNCAAVPRELIGSELFGHEKGAFTGATQRRLGRFELAHGGTIFLDEVGDLPMETQIALLRVLQERELERVGGNAAIRVDVRVVAATNRDLEGVIEAGTFRRDLFYRLNVFPIAVPPLRERTDDIPLLVEYFIDRYARKAGKRLRRVSQRTLDLLRTYPWPGNVRELQNVIERSVIICDTEEFTVDESWLAGAPRMEGMPALSSALAGHERKIIEDALLASGGRVYGPLGAAARLGIARSTLESRIRTLGIDKTRFRHRPTSR